MRTDWPVWIQRYTICIRACFRRACAAPWTYVLVCKSSSLPAVPSGFVQMNFSQVHFYTMSYLAASIHQPPDLHWCSMRQLHCTMSVHIMFCWVRCLWPQKSQVNWAAVTAVWACLCLPAWSDTSRWILKGGGFRKGLMDLVFGFRLKNPIVWFVRKC